MGILHLKDGLIAGMILGDGHLDKATPRLQLLHTVNQEKYLVFKLSLAKQVGYTARRYNNTTKNTNLGLYHYCSGIIKDSDILKFYNVQLGTLLSELNTLGLLIWWLDDGCLSIHQKQNESISRFGYLNTQAYGIDGNHLINKVLFEKFGLESSIHVDSKSGFAKSDHFRIYLNATNLRRLIDLVREFIPWIPNNMLYKLDMKYVVNRLVNSEKLVELYNF
jgi:hypothetical protein